MSTTTAPIEPPTVERAVRAARSMYPAAEVKVRRGRVVAIEGDVIRIISYRTGKPSDAAIGDN
jgi:hypothetical protein